MGAPIAGREQPLKADSFLVTVEHHFKRSPWRASVWKKNVTVESFLREAVDAVVPPSLRARSWYLTEDGRRLDPASTLSFEPHFLKLWTVTE